jgi:HD-GYP domain-containing protein (c-di-GMP phosphodiesterase class II)
MAEILLVGADKDRASGLRSLLRADGHEVTWDRSIARWTEREREIGAEVVVAAVDPSERLFGDRTGQRRGFPAPLLVVQHDAEIFAEPHVEERVVDRLSGAVMGDEFLARVDALVRVHRVVRGETDRAARGGPAPVPTGISNRIARWLRARLPRDEKPQAPYLEVASRVAEWADRRDAFQPGHAERVAAFCELIGGVLGLPEAESQALMRAALLHDVGKIGLPVELLHQRQPLEDAQRRLIRTHPARGAAILRALTPDEDVARMVLYHHECPNGRGYYGKAPEAVPRGARVLAVAEAYDAMTSSTFSDPLVPEAALDVLRSQKGERYEAEVVDALAQALAPRRGLVLSH